MASSNGIISFSGFSIRDTSTWVPTYGQWCGPNWSAGLRNNTMTLAQLQASPVAQTLGIDGNVRPSPVDLACKAHDIAYFQAAGQPNQALLTLQADLTLIQTIAGMTWSNLNSTEKSYTSLMAAAFSIKISTIDLVDVGIQASSKAAMLKISAQGGDPGGASFTDANGNQMSCSKDASGNLVLNCAQSASTESATSLAGSNEKFDFKSISSNGSVSYEEANVVAADRTITATITGQGDNAYLNNATVTLAAGASATLIGSGNTVAEGLGSTLFVSGTDAVKTIGATFTTAGNTQITTSADGKTFTAVEDANGDGKTDLQEKISIDATGAITTDIKDFTLTTALKDETTTVRQVDGSKTVSTDTDGNGKIDETDKFSSAGIKTDDVLFNNTTGLKSTETLFNAAGSQTDCEAFNGTGQLTQDVQLNNGVLLDSISYANGLKISENFYTGANQLTTIATFIYNDMSPGRNSETDVNYSNNVAKGQDIIYSNTAGQVSLAILSGAGATANVNSATIVLAVATSATVNGNSNLVYAGTNNTLSLVGSNTVNGGIGDKLNLSSNSTLVTNGAGMVVNTGANDLIVGDGDTSNVGGNLAPGLSAGLTTIAGSSGIVNDNAINAVQFGNYCNLEKFYGVAGDTVKIGSNVVIDVHGSGIIETSGAGSKVLDYGTGDTDNGVIVISGQEATTNGNGATSVANITSDASEFGEPASSSNTSTSTATATTSSSNDTLSNYSPSDSSSDDFACNDEDPIILNLQGNQVQTIALSGSSTYFDMQNTGQRVQTAWATAGEGMLVYDPTNTDAVTQDVSLVAGFDALSSLANSSSDTLDASNPLWSQLKVWIDQNGDATYQQGELMTLDQLGIASINLKSAAEQVNSNGNTILNDSTFTWNNGATGDIAGVDLALNPGIAAIPSTISAEMASSINQLLQSMSAFTDGNTGIDPTFSLSSANADTFLLAASSARHA